MRFEIVIEKFDSESGNPVDMESHSFCSEDCANEFLFETFELEGVNLKTDVTFPLTDCKITVCKSDTESQCEFGC